jgi:6-phosphogluconolactonase/glucosamine-6-phosphate isomerase/deaminase
MTKLVTKDLKQFAEYANAWCAEKIAAYQAKRIFLPSGGTPQALYKLWESHHPSFLNGLELTQLDEVITGPKAGCFKSFFKAHLPSYASQFVELEEQEALPDLVVLGIGVNGHVAFHEPHVPKDFFKGIVQLSTSTCERLTSGQVFDIQGLSYGVGCFMQSKAILLMIHGKEKEMISKEFFENPKADFPAALLKQHSDLTVLVYH